MRNVLIATPCKGEITLYYIRSLIELVDAGKLYPDTRFHFRFLAGTSVNFARNQLAQEAKELGCDKIVFADSDIGNWFPGVLRLIDHRLPVVAALYTAKKLGARPWLEPAPGEKPNADGILRVNEVATGFMCIDVAEVFGKLEKFYPESAYVARNSPTDAPKVCFEHFPMGVMGPNSFEDKIQSIKKLVGGVRRTLNPTSAVAKIRDVLARTEPGNIRGEDYYFCYRCRMAGIPIYADTKILVPHYDGATQYPMDPAKILEVAAQLKAISK